MNGLHAPRYDQAYLAWNTVSSYESYEEAQAAVTRLAQAGFPVAHLDLVGSDVRIIERITGTMSRGKAALAGAASGLWTGLFVGLLMSFFATGPGIIAALLTGLLIGAGVGAMFGLAGRSAMGSQRGFASLRTTVAGRYDLVARNGFAEQARQLLAGGQQPSNGWVTA